MMDKEKKVKGMFYVKRYGESIWHKIYSNNYRHFSKIDVINFKDKYQRVG